MSRLAVIPARGGSKRIPDKNIIEFCGRPMIAYALQAAQESGIFDRIHVSTDSQRIADVAEELGFPVEFLRPAELADDFTPIMPVLKNVAETFAAAGQSFDSVCLIMAVNPLLEAKDLVAAAELFDSRAGRNPVMAVVPFPVPVEWAYAAAADGRLVPREPGKFAIRSQDLEQHYFDAGSFVIYPADKVIDSEGAGDDTEFYGYPLARYKGIDIDDKEDLEFVEIVYRGLYGS